MLNFLRTLRRVKNKTKKEYAESFEKDEHGNYIINIKTKSIESLFGTYYMCDYAAINEGLYNDIDSICYNLPVNAKMIFNISILDSNKIPDAKTKEEFVISFKHHYILKSLNTEREKRTNLIIAMICLGFMIIFLGILGLVEIFAPTFYKEALPDVAWEILVIAGWVFGWEMCDRICFRQPELNFYQIKNYHLYHAKIAFVKDKKKVTIVPPTIENIEIKSFDKIDKDVIKAEEKEKTLSTKKMEEEKKERKTQKLD